jgi:predicted membrane protein
MLSLLALVATLFALVMFAIGGRKMAPVEKMVFRCVILLAIGTTWGAYAAWKSAL